MKIPAMSHLLKAIDKSDHKNFRHATLVMRGGSLISVGYNRGQRHSEYAALNTLWPDKRAGTTIINLRVTPAGNFGNCKPCKVCKRYLILQKVSKMVYFDGFNWISERVR